MTKKKEIKKVTVSKAGERYLCGECGSEVEYGHESCGTCKNKIDWNQIKIQMRTFIPQ